MKKLILITLGVILSHVLVSQITYRDSAQGLTIAGYAGVMSGPVVSVETPTTGHYATMRVGGDFSWQQSKSLILFGTGSLELNNSAPMITTTMMGATIGSGRTKFSLGKILTPMTDIRPVINSRDGQFEFWAQYTIPANAIGGKLSHKINDKVSLSVGSFWRDTTTTLEGGLKVGKTNVAGYYSTQDQSFGLAGITSNKYFDLTLSYNYQKTVGSYLSVNLPSSWYLFSDVGFTPTGQFDFVRGEWGVYKTLQVKYSQILYGVAYDHGIKSVKGYVMINLGQ